MEARLERLREIEKRVEQLEEAYAEELAELSKSRGFDVYEKKWDKKMEQLAQKYADLIYPLKSEHDELRAEVNKDAEMRRKKQFRDAE